MNIPDHELIYQFARSSGPGGQHVNKTESKVLLQWDVDASMAFSDTEKQQIKQHLKHRISKDGVLMIHADTQRSQQQNRREAQERLESMIATALQPVKKRKPTKPTRASQQRRLEKKKQQAQKKASRRPPLL